MERLQMVLLMLLKVIAVSKKLLIVPLLKPVLQHTQKLAATISDLLDTTDGVLDGDLSCERFLIRQ